MIEATKTISVVRGSFREYYFKHSRAIEEPDKIEQREFGYSQFGQPGMIRHLSFSSIKELHAMLIKEVPSDVYCSNAYYKFPTQPMHEKQWSGADLIFDIDGKDLDLPCIPSHTYPVCSNCGHVSSPADEMKEYLCPTCNGRKAERTSIPCSKCIEGSKKEVRRLLEFLTDDLGIQRDNVFVYFSGNNGFHIYVYDNEYISLGPQARSDIFGYLSGTGLMAESVGVRKGREEGMSLIKFPRGGLAYGWRGRIADKLKIDGSSIAKLAHIVEQKGGYSGFKAELDIMTREMGVRIDPQVTTDVHRIFRMPGTLNSKSSLVKTKCADLDSFNPFNEACMLGTNKVSVRVKTHIKLKLRGESFNISKETVEIPAFAAVYLICKGLAEAM